MSCTIYDLEQEVRAEVKSRMPELLSDRYYSDALHEIADSAVPVYNSDRADCLADDLSLAEVDDEGLAEGVTNVFERIGIAIYEKLLAAAYDEYNEQEEEWEEYKCVDCGDFVTDELLRDASMEAFGEVVCESCTDDRREEDEEEERREDEERRLREEEGEND